MLINLVLHHTGIAVNSIDDVLPDYIELFGVQAVSPKYFISSQQVNVCFIEVAKNVFLELVEASTENSTISKLAKKGINYYHVAYKAVEFEQTIIRLQKLNYKIYEVFKSEAFDNKRCVFLHNPHGHLIELIEV